MCGSLSTASADGHAVVPRLGIGQGRVAVYPWTAEIRGCGKQCAVPLDTGDISAMGEGLHCRTITRGGACRPRALNVKNMQQGERIYGW